MVEKAKWKSLDVTLPRKMLHSCGIVEVRATADLKGAGTVTLTVPPFSSPMQPVQRTDGSWRTAADCHKLTK